MTTIVTMDVTRLKDRFEASFLGDVAAAVLSPIRDFVQRHDLPISGLTVSFVFSAVLWVWTPYLLLGRRLPWRRLAPTGLLTAASVAIYAIGCPHHEGEGGLAPTNTVDL